MVVALTLILGLSAAVRLADLSRFPTYVFDEYYYVHDALAIVHGDIGPTGAEPWRPGSERSAAHPELGKLTIAAGILLFGDRPLGWRLMPALAGIALIALVYPLARLLFLGRRWALLATALAASDSLLIVESRLGVLDILVAFWSTLAVVFALAYTRSGWRPTWLAATGVALGCATATKWSGVLALLAVICVIAVMRRVSPADRPGRHPFRAVAALTVIPLSVYVLSYSAYFLAGHTPGQWLTLQRHMATFGWGVHGDLSFASRPETWIFDATPIWYKWFESADGTVGLLAIGNPVLWWAAVPCLVVLLLRALRGRDLRIALLPVLVAALYLPWLATSRQTYIYYLAPVVPFLALSVAAALSASREADRQSWRTVLAWFVAGMAAAALAYPLLWLVARTWETASSSPPLTVAAAAGGVGLVVVTVVVLVRDARARAAATWVYSGAVAGAGVALLPFLIGLPVAFDYYHRLMLFTAWR